MRLCTKAFNLTTHIYINNYNIYWVNVKILDKSNEYFSRLMSQLIQIISNNKAVNVKNATQNVYRICN